MKNFLKTFAADLGILSPLHFISEYLTGSATFAAGLSISIPVILIFDIVMILLTNLVFYVLTRPKIKKAGDSAVESAEGFLAPKAENYESESLFLSIFRIICICLVVVLLVAFIAGYIYFFWFNPLYGVGSLVVIFRIANRHGLYDD